MATPIYEDQSSAFFEKENEDVLFFRRMNGIVQSFQNVSVFVEFRPFFFKIVQISVLFYAMIYPKDRLKYLAPMILRILPINCTLLLYNFCVLTCAVRKLHENFIFERCICRSST